MARMDDATFWNLIARLDWANEGDDDAVVEPLINAIAALRDSEIAGFQDALAAALYALDGRAWARESGSDIWFGEPDSLSEDAFLYARCAVVASGEAFYRQVLADPAQMPKNREFEALLYVASTAYERKTGLDSSSELPESAVSFETFSNEAGWPPVG
jgi:hypothetical protein